MKNTARKNLKITRLVSLLAGIMFLLPIIEIFYKHVWLSIFQIILIANVYWIITRIFELPTSIFADTNGRKKSLMLSALANVFSAFLILFFPNLRWFAIASALSWLYFCFWSWTQQAFIDENLRILGNQKWFGKEYGNNLFFQWITGVVTPLIASLILKYFTQHWYTILAWLDLIFAIILLILQAQIVEVSNIKKKINTYKEKIKEALWVAKNAIINVYKNRNLRNFTIYRSLSSGVMFLSIILLPTLSQKWMPDRYSWIIAASWIIAFVVTSKFLYKIWEKHSYNLTRIIWTLAQGIILVIVWLFFDSWIFIWVMFILINISDWFIQSSRNHILVEQTNWFAIATTRSIIYSILALYSVLMKQILSFIDLKYALIILWLIILIANIVFCKKILNLSTKE